MVNHTELLGHTVNRYCLLIEQEVAMDGNCPSVTQDILEAEQLIIGVIDACENSVEPCLLLRQCWQRYSFSQPEISRAVGERLWELDTGVGLVGALIELSDILDQEFDPKVSAGGTHNWKQEGF